jgi:aldose sugar dehydrogenase
MSGGSASSLVDGIWRYGGDDASITRSIRDGHPDAGMPAMRKKFNDAEIRGLVIYIREKSAEAEGAHTKYNSPTPGTVVASENSRSSWNPSWRADSKSRGRLHSYRMARC